MAVAPDHRDNPQTPEILELAWGRDVIAWGADDISFGRPLPPKPQTPERLIVAAAQAIGIPAYAVYQPGGTPTLPSIVFQSTGVLETDTLHRGHLQSQDFLIQVRAECYADTMIGSRFVRGVVEVTNDFYESLRNTAGSRYNGITGQWTDEFAPGLNYRERSFSVTIRR